LKTFKTVIFCLLVGKSVSATAAFVFNSTRLRLSDGWSERILRYRISFLEPSKVTHSFLLYGFPWAYLFQRARPGKAEPDPQRETFQTPLFQVNLKKTFVMMAQLTSLYL